MKASPMIEAGFIAWKAAELSAALGMSKGWIDAGRPSPTCVYREEALQLCVQIRARLDAVEADLQQMEPA